ncbi:DUF4190 domain-containing protein [Nocardioides sp. zg-ZUI104]|uniref:DUF4190 domain-containing protein n=1 Tax=Nocardioides faecalis TaxID=2803858 RepID=UPI001BCDBF04|nr:DUF4190 domain-containing protein [Nocardioides faecalis]MBS4751521.1 DUF4190 domain-containing protein [Nocardioides faecalis]
MSDPYGQNPNQPGQDPYGQGGQPGQPGPGQPGPGQPGQPGHSPYAPPPSANPYGAPQGGGYGPPSGGYPGGYPGGAESGQPKTDGLSVAALVLSFLCCLAPVGLILGILGLSRTKGGQRKGRGLAIAAIIVGIVMTLASAGVATAVFIFADSIVTPANAKVGQCVDVEEDGGTVNLLKKDCTEKHDGEIVGVEKVTASNLEDIEQSMAGYCATAIDSDDLAKLSDYLTDIKAVIEDPKNVKKGDTLVCYVEPEEELSEPLL